MYQILIKNYIVNLTKEDIVSFAYKEGFQLEEKELEFIYHTIKKDWQALLYGNALPILENIKHHVRPEIYQYILKQYETYHDKL